VQTTTYAADNKSAQDKELVIEHAVQPEWKLVDTPKPFETTQSVYRFKGAAPANKVTTLAVKQEWVRNETISLVDNDLSELLTYSRSGQMPKSVRDALAQAVQLKQAVADLDQQITARTQQIGEITAEQTRIRENMRTVAPNSQYYDRLLSKLNEQESTIEKVQGERKDLMAKRDAARAELQRYLETLNVN
jgi:DNA repair ATPase RecN